MNVVGQFLSGSVLTPWVAASRLPLEEAPGAEEAEAATGAVEVTGVTEVTVTEGAEAIAAEEEGEEEEEVVVEEEVATTPLVVYHLTLCLSL